MQFKENIFEGKQCCYHLIIGFKDPALKAYVRQLSNYPIVQLNLETFKWFYLSPKKTEKERGQFDTGIWKKIKIILFSCHSISSTVKSVLLYQNSFIFRSGFYYKLMKHSKWSNSKNFQKGVGLTGPQLLEGDCWERGGDFFQGGCNFYIKYIKIWNIWWQKKFMRKNIFLCHK